MFALLYSTSFYDFNFRCQWDYTVRKLAGLLAAAPVSLPVVRLIRQTMLPQSSQVHVAEVFLGGILKPLSLKGRQYSPKALICKRCNIS